MSARLALSLIAVVVVGGAAAAFYLIAAREPTDTWRLYYEGDGSEDIRSIAVLDGFQQDPIPIFAEDVAVRFEGLYGGTAPEPGLWVLSLAAPHPFGAALSFALVENDGAGQGARVSCHTSVPGGEESAAPGIHLVSSSSENGCTFTITIDTGIGGKRVEASWNSRLDGPVTRAEPLTFGVERLGEFQGEA